MKFKRGWQLLWQRVVPSSLFGRALIILIAPMIIAQMAGLYIFYERHWASITRHLASSLAGEVALMVEKAASAPDNGSLEHAARLLGLHVQVKPKEFFLQLSVQSNDFLEYRRYVEHRLTQDVRIYENKYEQVVTAVAMPDATLMIYASRKRLVSSTTYIFVLWVVVISLALISIATIFLRNQIRPIRALARAAERFGRGQEDAEFRPAGAWEVRQAARAFLIMRGRVARLMQVRASMLAGISHDLRTPLTRMKLELALLPDDAATQEIAEQLNSDIHDMEQMLTEYLHYIRASEEVQEHSELVWMPDFLQQLYHSYIRTHPGKIGLGLVVEAALLCKPRQLRRALENVIVNAMRYGEIAHISAQCINNKLVVKISDNGAGIPEAMQTEVFRPFKRLEDSRNPSTGGVGLGLSIAQDIVHMHGGRVELHNRRSSDGCVEGLDVRFILPLQSEYVVDVGVSDVDAGNKKTLDAW